MNIFVNNVVRPSFCRTTNIRNAHKTYYEVLNLPRTCSLRDVKQSYIDLSKKYHPDISKELASQKKFVEVAEAYNILSKPNTRKSYDLGLALPNVKSDATLKTRNPWNDVSFWRNRDRTEDKFYESKPYYGIKGIKRVPNLVIVLACIAFTCVGVGLQMIAIRNSLNLQRQKYFEVSQAAEAHYKKRKEEAERNGNGLQLEKLRKRLMNSEYGKIFKD